MGHGCAIDNLPLLVSTNLVIANIMKTAKLSATDRRAGIVAAAIRLFSERGFRGVTTRELAAEVGVSEPVLYQHFATKRDLYTAIIDSKSQEVARVTSDLENYLETDDDYGFFRRLAELILGFHEKDPAYLRLLLFSALERHELADLFHARQTRAFFDAITRYIQRRVAQGAFRQIDPLFIAQSFAGMVAHFGLDRVLFPKAPQPLDRESTIDGMVSIFLKGIQND